MKDWRTKDDQELTKEDIREMRAAANECTEWRDRAIAAEAEVLVLAKALYGPELERRRQQQAANDEPGRVAE